MAVAPWLAAQCAPGVERPFAWGHGAAVVWSCEHALVSSGPWELWWYRCWGSVASSGYPCEGGTFGRCSFQGMAAQFKGASLDQMLDGDADLIR
eukprot:1022434-Pelagomonas_calceolata.AAC.2